jgi:hypothetical protein
MELNLLHKKPGVIFFCGFPSYLCQRGGDDRYKKFSRGHHQLQQYPALSSCWQETAGDALLFDRMRRKQHNPMAGTAGLFWGLNRNLLSVMRES